MGEISTDQLLALARDRSTAGRSQLADAIADLFEDQSRHLSDRERNLMYGILHHLVRETERAVREIISAQIAERPDVPRELAKTLADDTIEVAYPILTRCKALKDADLIEIIRNRAFEHQLAISLRYDVSERVSSELIATGNRDVIVTLLENSGAKLAQSTLAYLVEESKRVDSFQQPILRREDLDPELAKKMFMWVSAALRSFLLNKFQFDPATVDDLLEKAGIAGAQRASVGASHNPSDTLAGNLQEEGLINPELLIKALKERHVHLFVSMLTKTTGLRRALITRFLLEASGEGLAITCRSLGMTKDQFVEIFKLTSKARSVKTDAGQSPRASVLNLYDRMKRETAEEVVRHWLRNTEYLSAIRLVEQARNDAA
jgi:uncharacterized protein (DUF2336 family)